MKHTKGNWIYRRDTPRTFIIGSDINNRDRIIAVWSDDCISNKADVEEAEANAKLIAAAPELLEALISTKKQLEIVRSLCESRDIEVEERASMILHHAEQAIKKATE